jgi:hypothetical protein
MPLFLLYQSGMIKGRLQLTLAFVFALILIPVLAQIAVFYFGLIGFWSVVAALGILLAFASYGYARRKNDAAN